MQIASNQVVTQAQADSARWATATAGGAMFAQATFKGAASSGVAVALPGYSSGTSNTSAGTWYVFRQVAAGTSTSIVQKDAGAGTHTALASGGPALSSGDVIRLEYDGTTLTAKVNGTTVLTASPSTPINPSTQPYVGMAYGGTTAALAVLDDWSGGDLGLSTVATTKATSWAVKKAVATTRATTWTDAGKVVATVATSWNVGGPVTDAIATSWHVLTTISPEADKVASWAVRGAVSLTRAASWNVAASPIVSYSDNFNRADGTLGANWVTTNSTTYLQLASNAVVTQAAAASARWATTPTADAQFSQATYKGGTGVGVAVAMPSFAVGSSLSTAGTWYAFRRSTSGGATVLIQKDAGASTNTTLASGGPDVVAGDVLRVEWDGTTLVGKINGVTALTYTPPTPITGQKGVGLGYGSTTGGVTILDDWSGGDMTASVSTTRSTTWTTNGPATTTRSTTWNTLSNLSPTAFTDDFNRADGTLGSNWNTTGASPLHISSSQVASQGASAVAEWATPASSGSIFSQATYLGGTGVGVAVAMPAFATGTSLSSAGTWYVFRRSTSTASTTLLQKDAGASTHTTLLGGGPNVSPGDVLRLEYDGTTLTAKVNGTVVLTFTPTTPITGQKYTGISYGSTSSIPILDNWSGGNLGLTATKTVSTTWKVGAGAPTVAMRWSGLTGNVRTKTTGATSVRLKVGTDPAVSTGVFYTAPQTPDDQGYTTHALTGTAPGQQYYYRVAMTDSTSAESLDALGTVGKIKAAPTGPTSFSFVAVSCDDSTTGSVAPIIAAGGDDFFFHLGDLYYADGTAQTVDNYRSKVLGRVASSTYQSLLATVPSGYAASDHDSTFTNNGNVSSQPTGIANFNQVYREVVPNPVVQPTTGWYQTFTWGRVRFIAVDQRSFASPISATDNSSKTMLGATQKQWLKDTITAATEPLIVLLGDTTWIGAASTGSDGWLGFTTERAELGAFFLASGKRIAYIGGDMHALAADTGVHAVGNIFEFQSAPIHHTAQTVGGPYSVGPVPASGTALVEQFGRFTIRDSAGSLPTISMVGLNSAGTQQMALAFNRVDATRSTTWNVGTFKVTVPTTWAVRKQVTTTTATSWKTVSGVLATKAASWKVRSQVTPTRVASWAVRVAVPKTKTASWAVRTRLGRTWSSTWRVASPIVASPVATRATTWHFTTRVDAPGKQVIWADRKQVTATRGTTWTTRRLISTRRYGRWAVRIITVALPPQAVPQPYYVRDRQDWAVGQERMRHNQALYMIGEYAMFVLMWHIADFNNGLVAHCQRCRPGADSMKTQIANVYNQPEKHRCPDCFGTTFEGGFKARIVRPAIFSDADEDEQKQARGVTNPQDLSIESTTDFRVRSGDYVFRQTGDRYQLRVPDRVTLRTGFGVPHQSQAAIGYNHARANQEDKTSVAFIIPPAPEQLDSWLNVSQRSPYDFSALEIVRAPLIPVGDD